MKKATLVTSIIFENTFSYLLIFVLVGIISFLLQGASNMTRSYYEVIGLSKDSGIENKVLVVGSDFANPFFGDELFEQKLESISMMPEVESVSMTDFQGFIGAEQVDVNERVIFMLDGVYEDVYGKMEYPLVCGKWPDKPCEIALEEKMCQTYEIGDQITVGVYHFSGFGEKEEIDIVETVLTVTGFIPMDAQMLTWRVNDKHADISSMSTTFREQEEQRGTKQSIIMGVGVPPLDSSGLPFGSSYECATLLITPTKDCTPDCLIPSLTRLFDEGQIHIGSELVERYYEKHLAEYKDMVRNLIIVSSLALSTLFSSVFLQLRKKRLEMTVYYMCGITWKQSISLFCITYIPIILLSFISGTAIYMAFRESRRWFDGKDSLWILLILLAVTLLFILPLYILARRSSPVEQTRKD